MSATRGVFGGIVFFTLISFMLHFAWESAHIPLYTDYEGLSGDMPTVLWASIGDVLYGLAALGLYALLKRRADWLVHARAADYFALALIGFLLALGIEYKALVLGRWAYTSAMPIIPLLRVGLSPIAQMALLLPLSVYLAARASALAGRRV